jgi:uncharacterized protein (TIGR03437 family)
MKRLPLVLGLALAASSAVTAQEYTISTIAGEPLNSNWFGDGDPAIYAQFVFPFRVAVDSKGNYFISDLYSNVIREVNTTGVISTVAGNGTYGFQGDNYIATQAEFTDVHGIAVDSSGNLYLVDTSNHRIRKVVPGGNITTIAGLGTIGYSGDGGAAINAQMNYPYGVAVDTGGNVYIVDHGNNVIRKVTPSGTISTIAGSVGSLAATGDGGPAAKATFGAVYAIAVSSAGNIYVSDTLAQNIREITTDGNIHTAVSGVTAISLAVDSAGNIYYPDSLNNLVWKVAPGGSPVVIAGNGTAGYSGDGGPATFAQLNLPCGIALDSSNNVYIADSSNYLVRRLTPTSVGISAIQNAGSAKVTANAAQPIPGTVASVGEIISLYGAGLGPSTPVTSQPANGSFPNNLAGTTVTFDGHFATILYTSATQVIAIVPYEETLGNTALVTVRYNGQSTVGAPVYINYTAPGIFTLSGNGLGQAAAVNQNGKINGASVPAPLGSFISIYATGGGNTSPVGTDGAIVQGAAHTQLAVTATVGGVPAVVTYAGAAPGEVSGVLQVNLQIPATVTPGPAVPVVLQVATPMGAVLSQSGATIAVSAN